MNQSLAQRVEGLRPLSQRTDSSRSLRRHRSLGGCISAIVLALVLSVLGVGGFPHRAEAAEPSSAVGATVPWKIAGDVLVINCQDQTGALKTGTWNTDEALTSEHPAPWAGESYKTVAFETATRPTKLAYVFYQSPAETFNLANLDTSAVTTMEYMFADADSVKALDVRGFSVADDIQFGSMFENMDVLETIYCNDAWPALEDQELFAETKFLWSRLTLIQQANTFSGGGPLNATFANPTQGYFTPLSDELTIPLQVTLSGNCRETLDDVGRYFVFDFEIVQTAPEVPQASPETKPCHLEELSLDNDTGEGKIGVFRHGDYPWPDDGVEVTVKMTQKEPSSCGVTGETNYMGAWSKTYDRRAYYLKLKLNRWGLTQAQAFGDEACAHPVAALAFENVYHQPEAGIFQMQGNKRLMRGTPVDGEWIYDVEAIGEGKMMPAESENGAWTATNVGADIQFPEIVLTQGGSFQWVVKERSKGYDLNRDSRAWLVMAEVGAVWEEDRLSYRMYSVHYYRDDLSTCKIYHPNPSHLGEIYYPAQCEFSYENRKLAFAQSAKGPDKTLDTWTAAQNGQRVYFRLEARKPTMLNTNVTVTIPEGLDVDEESLPESGATLASNKRKLTWRVSQDALLEWSATVKVDVGRDVVVTTAETADGSETVNLQTVISKGLGSDEESGASRFDQVKADLEADGFQATDALKATPPSTADEVQKNYQSSVTGLTSGDDAALASYLTKSAQWTNKEEGLARIDLEAACAGPSVSSNDIPIYIFTTCQSHHFSRDIAENNVRHLMSLYGIVDVRYVDTVGRVTDDRLFYDIDHDENPETENHTNAIEITIMFNSIRFSSDVHFSNGVSAALRDHIFGTIAAPIDEEAIVHDPIAIYVSFDNTSMSPYYSNHVTIDATRLDLWSLCEQPWFDFLYERYVKNKNRYFSMANYQDNGADLAHNIRPVYYSQIRSYTTSGDLKHDEAARCALGLAGLMSPENYGKVGEYRADYNYAETFDSIFTTGITREMTLEDRLSDWLSPRSVSATYAGKPLDQEDIAVEGQSVAVTVKNYGLADASPLEVTIEAAVKESALSGPEAWFDTNASAATLSMASNPVETVASPVLSYRPQSKEVTFTPEVYKRVMGVDGAPETDWPFAESPFAFRLEAQDGAPAPAQAEASTDASGKAAWPALSLAAPGEYRYTVTEVPGAIANMDFDERAHTLTISVDEAQVVTTRWDGDEIALDADGKPVGGDAVAARQAPLITNVLESPLVLPEAGGTPTRALALCGLVAVTGALAAWSELHRRRRH